MCCTTNWWFARKWSRNWSLDEPLGSGAGHPGLCPAAQERCCEEAHIKRVPHASGVWGRL